MTSTKKSPFNLDVKAVGSSSMQQTVNVRNMMPPEVKGILTNMFASVGLQFDPSNIDLTKDLTGELKRVREVVEMIHNNSKLLPLFAAELKKAMAAAKKYGKFQADIVREGLKAQAGIDKEHADILLSFAGYVKEKNATEAKLTNKMKKLAKASEAQNKFYAESWGAQAETIDAKWELIRDTKVKSLEATRQSQVVAAQRADRSREYVARARGVTA